MDDTDDSPRFERVDWDELDRTRRTMTLPRLTFAVGLLIVVSLFLYDHFIAHVYLVFDWRVDAIDWAFLLGIVVLTAFGIVPAIERRRNVKRYLKRFLSRPATIFAGGFLSLFVLVGIFGPIFYTSPGLEFGRAFHPPVGFSSEIVPNECLGEVTGDVFDRRCHGSWEYPLGTNHRGHPTGYLVVAGTRIALYVAVFTAAFVIPIAAITGVIAGLRGGIVDDLLMGYVDIQLSIPAIIVYFIGYIYWNPSLLLLLMTFGLLSWGGIARLVRSEVLQRREDGHVMVARSLGASQLYIAKRHILPNVTNTVVPAAFHLLALLVLIEAGVAFLGFHHIEMLSWGSTIAESINAEVPPQMMDRAAHPAHQIWWVSTFPALALGLTMLSFKIAGDGLRDALDPRKEV